MLTVTEKDEQNLIVFALSDPLSRERIKKMLKELLNEWLDEQWATFGKWTFRGFTAMLFIAVMYLWLKAKGAI